ncbi:MAG TPA: hypothetical protein VIJ93_02510 [bacterium]
MKNKKPAPPPSSFLPLSYEGEKRFFHKSDPIWKGFGTGVILFLLFLAILLFSGDLSASKFIYVDF